MLQIESAEQLVLMAGLMLLGMVAGRYAWRTAVRYALALQAGADPDSRLMLQAVGGAAMRPTHTTAASKVYTVLAAGGLALAYGWLSLLALPAGQWAVVMLFMFALLLLACIDARCGLLPDALTLPLLLSGLLVSVVGWGLVGLWESVLSAVFAYGLLFGLAWLFQRVRGRDGLGGGDIKCMAAIAAWCGLQGLFIIMLVSSLIGIGYAVMMRREGAWSKSYPFGPCLALAVIMYLGFSLQV